MSFNSKPFNVDVRPELGGCSWVLVGASKSGKTTLMKYIMKNWYKKHITTMFTLNSQAEIYENLSSKIMICPEYFPELIKEQHQINNLCDNKFPFMIIFDDYTSAKMKNCPQINRLMTVMRNANTSCLFSAQGRVMLNALGRNNANYICIFKQQTPKEWENVIKEYLSMWLPFGMTMKEMIKFCQEATVEHQFFCIDQISGECYLTKLSKAQIELE
jgi:adenylate kinase family enzyme